MRISKRLLHAVDIIAILLFLIVNTSTTVAADCPFLLDFESTSLPDLQWQNTGVTGSFEGTLADFWAFDPLTDWPVLDVSSTTNPLDFTSSELSWIPSDSTSTNIADTVFFKMVKQSDIWYHTQPQPPSVFIQGAYQFLGYRSSTASVLPNVPVYQAQQYLQRDELTNEILWRTDYYLLYISPNMFMVWHPSLPTVFPTTTYPVGSVNLYWVDIPPSAEPITITVEGVEYDINPLTGQSTTVPVSSTQTITSPIAACFEPVPNNPFVGGNGTSDNGGDVKEVNALDYIVDNLGNLTDDIITGNGGHGNVAADNPEVQDEGNTYAQILALNGEWTNNSSALGIQPLIDLGVTHALDIYGILPGDSPGGANHFATPVDICMQGGGDIYFVASSDVERHIQAPEVTEDGDWACVTLGEPGKLVMVNGHALTSTGADIVSGEIILLDHCRVTTLDMLNLREQPTLVSSVLAILPYDITYEATEYTPGWYRIIYLDMQGWVSEDWVTPRGCNV